MKVTLSPATIAQLRYAAGLLTERDLDAEIRPTWRARLDELSVYVPLHVARIEADSDMEVYGTLDRRQASALIEHLQTLPVKPRGGAEVTMGNVPAGRYAVTVEGAGHTAFYKVDVPTEGYWAGRTFVSLLVGDDERRLSAAVQKTILVKIIAAGPEFASARYGREIGACGVCGRTLTNEDSRARGIGPVCAARNGW